MKAPDNDDICGKLGLIAALISVAGVAIGFLEQINDCSCSEQEQSPDSRGLCNTLYT